MVYGTELEEEVREKANHKLKLSLKNNDNIEIKNIFDSENKNLIDNIEIIVEENAKANLLIKYTTKEDMQFYHNGIIRVIANKNSSLQIIIVNFLNTKSNNFLSIENQLEEEANVNYTIVDFGGKYSITNYYSNLIRKNIKKQCKCDISWKN